MQLRRLNPWLVILLSCVASMVALAQPAQQPSLSELEIADKLRIALQRLPYYGPFDLIGFEVHGTEVTLNGWVYQAINKDEAEGAARAAAQALSVPGLRSGVVTIDPAQAQAAVDGNASIYQAIVEMSHVLTSSEAAALLGVGDSMDRQLADRWQGNEHPNPQWEAANFLVTKAITREQNTVIWSRERSRLH